MIYTSGSTGQPKGVMIEHRSVNRLVCNADYVRLDANDCVAHASVVAFDAATFEIWGALLNGARLAILAKEVILDADVLGSAIKEFGVTTLFVTTALFNRLAHASPPPFAGLRCLLFGGEVAEPGAVRKVLQDAKPWRLVHVYGPTETTTFATSHEVTAVGEDDRRIPIGRPICNTRAHVLDRFGQRQPIGIPGELHIAGDGVARGYLRSPVLTGERFSFDPYSEDSRCRLYRTGDVVRQLPSGAYEFLGRFDRQAKIRGFRVEPEEVEAILASHPAVAECTVIVRDDGVGGKALVAYFVPRSRASVGHQAIRSFLKERLPEHMVPGVLTSLRELPLTANGKVDRERLPAPLADEGLSVTEPRVHTQLELHLIKLWQRLLGSNCVGIDDNFFDLGGHSLLAVRMVDEIERQFGRRIPLDALWYNGATVASLADLLEQDEATLAWPLLIPMRRSGSKPALFCVHTMGGNLFHYDALVHALNLDQPVFGLQARGVYGREKPRWSVEEIAADCVAAMRSQQRRGPYLIAGYSSGGWIAYEMSRQLRDRGEAVAALTLLDVFGPGLKRNDDSWSMIARTLRRDGIRHIQERVYHKVLFTLGLSRMRALRKIGEAQRWAFSSYRPKPSEVEVHLFRAGASADKVADPTLGWMALATRGVRIHEIAGSHSSIMKPPRVVELARELQDVLDSSTTKAGTVEPSDEALPRRTIRRN